MNRQTRSNKSQSLTAKLSIALTLAALPVMTSAAVPFTFTDGTPAIAAQVNANFAAHDEQLAALENLNLNLAVESVDCAPGADGAGALQDAIDGTPAKGLKISVTGACDAVTIQGKGNLYIEGNGSTTITGASDQQAMDIRSSGVQLHNLVADGANLAEFAISIGSSVVQLSGVTAINSAGSQNLTVGHRSDPNAP